MKFNRKPLFTHPREVEAAFYQAFVARDLEAMMAVWADEEEIACVFPSGHLLQGFNKIREGWMNLFSSQTGQLSLQLKLRQANVGVMMAMHHVIENIHIVEGDKQQHGAVLAVNVYQRTPDGWRLLLHQGTPMPADPNLPRPEVADPQLIVPVNRTLH